MSESSCKKEDAWKAQEDSNNRFVTALANINDNLHELTGLMKDVAIQSVIQTHLQKEQNNIKKDVVKIYDLLREGEVDRADMRLQFSKAMMSHELDPLRKKKIDTETGVLLILASTIVSIVTTAVIKGLP